jgi:hypothetical protein
MKEHVFCHAYILCNDLGSVGVPLKNAELVSFGGNEERIL